MADEIQWCELGCPQDVGLYPFAGQKIRVKRIHVLAAEDDPHARFTVVAFRPPLGRPEFMLGHRVA